MLKNLKKSVKLFTVCVGRPSYCMSCQWIMYLTLSYVVWMRVSFSLASSPHSQCALACFWIDRNSDMIISLPKAFRQVCRSESVKWNNKKSPKYCSLQMFMTQQCFSQRPSAGISDAIWNAKGRSLTLTFVKRFASYDSVWDFSNVFQSYR